MVKIVVARNQTIKPFNHLAIYKTGRKLAQQNKPEAKIL
jgi:hypothetical protein